jgi:hypothetical protein
MLELPYTICNALCAARARTPSPGLLKLVLAQNSPRPSESPIWIPFYWTFCVRMARVLHVCRSSTYPHLRRSAQHESRALRLRALPSAHRTHRFLSSVLARAPTTGCGRYCIMLVPSYTSFFVLDGHSVQMLRTKATAPTRA